MNWTFCWLPLHSSSARRSASRGCGSGRASRARRAGAMSRGHAVERRRSRRAGRGPPSAGRGRAPRAGSPRSGAAGRWSACRPSGSRRVSARRMPRQIRIVVVLPAPLAPRNPKMRPRGTSKLEVVERDGRAEPLGDAVDLEGHAAEHSPEAVVPPLGRWSGCSRAHDPERVTTPDAHDVRRLRAGRRRRRPRHARSTPIAPPGRSTIEWADGHPTTYGARRPALAVPVRATAAARPACRAGWTATPTSPPSRPA